MSETKKEVKNKTCFVIMPISDIEGYASGHFGRVYQYLIKPACEAAGYITFRADEVNKTNYIIIDILRKILDSDMVVCDLSGRNPNVLYELGIRQAFNKPVTLVKDNATDRIFDIQGLRCLDYDNTLRIDSVQRDKLLIEKVIKETEQLEHNEVNSMIKLLGVTQATIPEKITISSEVSLVLNAIKELKNDIDNNAMDKPTRREVLVNCRINNEKVDAGENLYIEGTLIGRLAGFNQQYIVLETETGMQRIIRNSEKYKKLTTCPF